MNQQNVSSSINSNLIDLSIRKYFQVNNKKNQNKKSRSEVCSGYIQSVNSQGIVKIVFNDIISQNLNISWINDTNTLMYVKPASNRHEFEDFSLSSVNFTWFVLSLIQDKIFVRLNFIQPLEISPLIQQDQLIVNFNGS